MATGGTAVAAVMITSNSQVAQNTISGHAPPSGKHANIISGSVSASDLNKNVLSTFTDRCPFETELRADLCFSTSDFSAADFQDAAKECSSLGQRLPDVGEVDEFFNYLQAPEGPYWTSEIYNNSMGFQALGPYLDANRLVAFSSYGIYDTLTYRCVATPTN
ncbi:MAG TPA: hypothetical protein VGI86_20290 [Acidimicrobiia bacterium]|jgi:hypothetical protein